MKKKSFKVLNVTFHLVLECSNFHPFFIWVSDRFPSPWIFTSTHHVDLGTLEQWGHSSGSAATESKVIAVERIDLRD